MKLGTQIMDRVFGSLIESRVERRMDALREATSRVKHNDGFRRLTGSERDLTPLKLRRQREIAVFLWERNPLARRILETLVEWIVGEGATISAEHPETQEYLDTFWDDPINRWDLKLDRRVRELFLFGEQFWPGFENQFNGQVRLGTIDPGRVKEVVTDPGNMDVIIGVVMKRTAAGEERMLRTMLRAPAQQILSPEGLREREKFVHGELFVFEVNKLSSQTRGVSELFALADWLEGYESLLFSLLNQERVRSMYLWDVELEGMTDDEVQEWLKSQEPPTPFSVRAHNEKVKWNLVGPDANASENSEVARMFRNHTLGGAAIPEHWYGGGGDVNRSTAESMSSPFVKSASAKQKIVKYVLEDVLAVQIERGIQAGALPDDDEVRQVSADMPSLDSRDLDQVANALQKVASALAVGRSKGWVSDDVAARLIASLASQMGVDVDPEKMLEEGRQSTADDITAAAERRRLELMEA